MARSVGAAFVQVGLDLSAFRKQLGEMPKLATVAGGKSGTELLKALQAEVQRRNANTKEAIAKGLISKEDARRIGQQTAHEFNAAVVKELDRLRAAGQQNTAEFRKLQTALRSTGDAGQRSIRNASEETSRWNRALGGVRTALAGIVAFVSVRAFAGFLRDAVRAAEEASRSWGVLAANVENAGVEFEAVRSEIEGAARAFQTGTRFGDEDFADALSEVVSITGNYRRSLDAMSVVLDLAAAKQIDLQTAAQLVGRAMVGQTGTLSRYGIVVEEGADALETMRNRFHGIAEKDGATLSGRLARLRNEWGDFKEAIGAAIVETNAGEGGFTDLADAIQRATEWVSENEGALQGWVTTAGKAVAKTAELIAEWGRILDPASAQAGEEIAAFEFLPTADDPAFIRQRQERQKERKAELVAERALLQVRLESAKAVAESTAGKLFGTGVVEAQQLEAQLKGVERQLEVTDRVAAHLSQKLSRILRGEPEGTGAGGGGGGKETELAARDIAAMRKRLEAELEIIERKIADAFTLETAPKAVAQLAAIPEKLAPAFKTLAPALTDVGAGLSVLRDRITAVRQAEAELTAARVAGDTEGAKKADEALGRAKAELVERTKQVTAHLRESGASGKVYRAAVEEIEKALRAAGVETEKLGKNLSFDAYVGAVETLGRGFLSAADSAGILTDETRRIVTGLLDVVDGLRQVKEAAALEGVAGALGTVAGVGAVAGGVFALGKQIFGNDEEKQRKEAARELANDLKDLHQQFRDLADVLGPLESAIRRLDDMIGSVADRLDLDANNPVELGAERERLLQEAARKRELAEDAPGKFAENLIRNAEELEKRAAELDEFADEYAAALAQIGQSFRDDLDAREAALQGEFAGGRQSLGARHEAEIADARAALERGAITDADLARLQYIQTLEREKQALEERRAAEDAELDRLALRAEITGTREDAIALATRRANIERDRELAMRKSLLEQGIISQEEFGEFARLLDEKVIKAIREAAEAFDEVAEAAQQAARDSALAKDELRATLTGDEEGVERIGIQQQANAWFDQVRAWSEAGTISFEEAGEFFDLIDKWVAEQTAKLGRTDVVDAAEKAALEGSAARERLSQTEVVRQAGSITAVHATAMVDIDRSILTLLRQHVPNIDKNLARWLSDGGGDNGGSGGGGGSSTNLNLGGVHVEVNAHGSVDGPAIAAAVKPAVMEGVDNVLAKRLTGQRRLTGSAQRR